MARPKQEELVKETKQLEVNRRNTDAREEVEKKQMQVVDETASIQEDITELAPKAASALKESIEMVPFN